MFLRSICKVLRLLQRRTMQGGPSRQAPRAVCDVQGEHNCLVASESVGQEAPCMPMHKAQHAIVGDSSFVVFSFSWVSSARERERDRWLSHYSKPTPGCHSLLLDLVFTERIQKTSRLRARSFLLFDFLHASQKCLQRPNVSPTA